MSRPRHRRRSWTSPVYRPELTVGTPITPTPLHRVQPRPFSRDHLAVTPSSWRDTSIRGQLRGPRSRRSRSRSPVPLPPATLRARQRVDEELALEQLRPRNASLLGGRLGGVLVPV